MNVLTIQSSLDRQHLKKSIRDGSILFAFIILTLALPPFIYGYLVWNQFGFLNVSGYIPFEEVTQALMSAEFTSFLMAPVLSMNMTSGDLLSNMYNLTVGQLLLTITLASAIGLNVIAQLNVRELCLETRPHKTAIGASSGLCATVAASSTGIMGCCGSGFGGGLLALAGVSTTTAGIISAWSIPLQVVFILGFAINWLRLRQSQQPVYTASNREPPTNSTHHT